MSIIGNLEKTIFKASEAEGTEITNDNKSSFDNFNFKSIDMDFKNSLAQTKNQIDSIINNYDKALSTIADNRENAKKAAEHAIEEPGPSSSNR